MADALAFDHEDDHFGDVGGVIGDAFEIFGDRADFRCPADGLRVLEHEGEGLAEDLRVQLIDFVIVLANLEREIGIFPHEGVEAFADHALGDARHAWNVDIGFELRFLVQFQRAFADIDRHVADPFQIGGDLESGGNEAQVASGGLMQGQELDAQDSSILTSSRFTS